MANSVGQIFVELDLDADRYTKAQQKLYKDATSTTLNIEQNFKNLGIKSSAEMDLMRQKVSNSFERIKNSSKATANDIIRAEQAKNETIERLNTQQFGKQESLLDKLKSNWIAAAAAIGAAYVTAQKAWNIVEQAASYEQSAVAFHTMATSMGTDATTEFNKIKEASKGLIDDKSLTESINKAMSLGIPIEKIGDLMLIARAKARDMGTDVSQAFSDIATGVGRASPLILDNLGLVMKVGSANEAMAASLGKTVAELTDQEKKTAILNATLEAGKEALARYDLETRTTAENMQAFKATMADLQLILGQGIIRAAAAVVGSFQSLSAASMTVSSGIWKIIEGKERLAAMVTWGEAEKRHMELAKEAAQNAQSDFESSIEYATKAQNNFELMIASTESLSNATKAGGRVAVEAEKAKTDAIEDTSKAAKKAAEEWEKLLQSSVAKEAKLLQEAMDGETKAIEESYKLREKEEEEYQKIVESAAAKEAKLLQEAMDEETKYIEKEQERQNKLKEDQSRYWVELSQRTAEAMEQNFSDLFFNVLQGQFTSLGDYATGILNSIQRAVADYMGQLLKVGLFGTGQTGSTGLVQAAGSWIGSLFASEQGNAFFNGRVMPYAQGGIVTMPTVFPMASGAGLMGEAGPEAILPLARTSSGDLGVKGGGSQVNVIINNNSSAKASAKEIKNAQGGQTLVVTIEDIVSNSVMTGGRIHGAIRKTFGMSPVLSGR